LTPLNERNVNELEGEILPGLLVLAILLFFALVVFSKGVRVGFITVLIGLPVTILIALIYDSIIANKIFLILSIIVVIPLSITILTIAMGVGSLAFNIAKFAFEDIGIFLAITTIIFASMACKYILPILNDVSILGSAFDTMLKLAIAMVMSYILHHSIKENGEFSWLQKIVIRMISATGTSFKNADLTDVDFEKAILRNADFRKATITRTNWNKVTGLEKACVQDSYLEDREIRELLISKEGENKKFDKKNLSQANLQGAILKGASFIGANLSEANLQDAQLSNSKLVDTQLYRAKMNYSCLTGACIQNWGISTETRLDNIKCDYIYMMHSSDGKVSRRKPDDEEQNFKNGEFSSFITPFINTLSFYHKQYTDPSQLGKIEILTLSHKKNDDPEAIIFALTKLENKYNSIDFQPVAVGSKGEDLISIEVAVTSGVGLSTLNSQHHEYFQEYTYLSPQEKQNYLATKNQKKLEKLQKLLSTVRESESSYIIIKNVDKMVMNYNSQNIDFSNATNITVGDINQVAADTIQNDSKCD
jgi:uncharacterized protein YjbI with pentapeptide repeats